MKIKILPAILASLLCLFWLALAGCGGSGGDGNSGANGNGNNGLSNSPSSISGKTYSFTVTARQGLTEPVGSTYSIAFNDASTFTFNPSPQNSERTNSVSGQYTFDPNTSVVHLSGVGEPITGTFHFASPASGTMHWMETDGEMQDATFAQL